MRVAAALAAALAVAALAAANTCSLVAPLDGHLFNEGLAHLNATLSGENVVFTVELDAVDNFDREPAAVWLDVDSTDSRSVSLLWPTFTRTGCVHSASTAASLSSLVSAGGAAMSLVDDDAKYHFRIGAKVAWKDNVTMYSDNPALNRVVARTMEAAHYFDIFLSRYVKVTSEIVPIPTFTLWAVTKRSEILYNPGLQMKFVVETRFDRFWALDVSSLALGNFSGPISLLPGSVSVLSNTVVGDFSIVEVEFTLSITAGVCSFTSDPSSFLLTFNANERSGPTTGFKLGGMLVKLTQSENWCQSVVNHVGIAGAQELFSDSAFSSTSGSFSLEEYVYVQATFAADQGMPISAAAPTSVIVNGGSNFAVPYENVTCPFASPSAACLRFFLTPSLFTGNVVYSLRVSYDVIVAGTRRTVTSYSRPSERLSLMSMLQTLKAKEGKTDKDSEDGVPSYILGLFGGFGGVIVLCVVVIVAALALVIYRRRRSASNQDRIPLATEA